MYYFSHQQSLRSRDYCPPSHGGCHYPSTPTRAPVATERILEVGGTAQYLAPPIPSYFRQGVALFLRFQKWQINSHRWLPAPMSYIYSEEICHNFLANFYPSILNIGFPGGSVVKNPPANAGDTIDEGSIPGLGRPPGTGNGNPLQYCLENPMDLGTCQATVQGSQKSWAWLNN